MRPADPAPAAPVGQYATVVSVETRVTGTQLVGAHAAGATVLQVADVGRLPETGSVVVGADTLTYTTITDTFNGAANDTITLTAATVNAYTDQAPVTLTPARRYKIALVVGVGESVAREARVKHNLMNKLPEGPRQEGAGETVWVRSRPGEFGLIVEDVHGREPSVDAAYIAASTLPAAAVDQADFVSAKIIADIVTATDMTAATITGATIQTALPGVGSRRTWMDSDGLHQASAGGVPRMDFPNLTGATNFLKGSLSADSLEVTGDGVFRKNMEITPGASVTLGQAESDPASPPTTLVDWEYVNVTRAKGRSYGLVRYSGAWAYVQATVSGFSLRTFADDGTGDVQVFSSFASDGIGGLVNIAGNWFTVGFNPTSILYLSKFNGSGAVLASAPVSDTGVFGLYAPAIGTNGTNVLVAYCAPDGFLHIDTYSATTLARTAQLTTTRALTGDVAAVLSGTFDLSGPRFVVAVRGDDTVYVQNADGTAAAGENFATGDKGNNSISGLAWDGTNFRSMADTVPKLYKHTGAAKTDSAPNLTYWISYAYKQAAGGYHTKVSPASQITIKKRSRLNVSAGSVPGSLGAGDPDGIDVFIGRGATDPGPSASYLNATTTGGSGDALVTTPVFTGTTAWTANTFPSSGAAGRIKAAGGSVIIDGTYTSAYTLPQRLATLEAGGSSYTAKLLATQTTTNTVTETTHWTPANIAATALVVGSLIRVRLVGTLDNAATSGTFTGRLKANGITIATVPIAVSQTTLATAVGWFADLDVYIETTGAGGVVSAAGLTSVVTAAGGGRNPIPNAQLATTVDLTAGCQLTWTVQMGTASASNIIRTQRANAVQAV